MQTSLGLTSAQSTPTQAPYQGTSREPARRTRRHSSTTSVRFYLFNSLQLSLSPPKGTTKRQHSSKLPNGKRRQVSPYAKPPFRLAPIAIGDTATTLLPPIPLNLLHPTRHEALNHQECYGVCYGVPPSLLQKDTSTGHDIDPWAHLDTADVFVNTPLVDQQRKINFQGSEATIDDIGVPLSLCESWPWGILGPWDRVWEGRSTDEEMTLRLKVSIVLKSWPSTADDCFRSKDILLQLSVSKLDADAAVSPGLGLLRKSWVCLGPCFS